MNTNNKNILNLNYDKDEIYLIKKVTKMLIAKAKKNHGLNVNYGEFKLAIHDRECSFVTIEPKLRLVDMDPEKNLRQKAHQEHIKEQQKKAYKLKNKTRY